MRILDRSTLKDVTFSHKKAGFGITVTVTVTIELHEDDEFNVSDFDQIPDDVIEAFLRAAHADIEQKIRTYALPFKQAWSKQYDVKPTHKRVFSLILV